MSGYVSMKVSVAEPLTPVDITPLASIAGSRAARARASQENFFTYVIYTYCTRFATPAEAT